MNERPTLAWPPISRSAQSLGLAPVPPQASPWQVAWRRWGTFTLGMLVVFGVGGLVYTQLPRTYQSTAQVLVVQKLPYAVTGVDSRHGAMEDYLATQQELVKSTLILEQAIQEHGLESLPSLAGAPEGPVEVIRKGLTVSRSKGAAASNSIIQLSYRGAVPQDCSAVLAAILDTYGQFIARKYQTLGNHTLDLLLRERDAVRRELSQQEQAYQAFREKSPLVLKGKDGPDLGQERLNTILAKRSTLQLRRAELQGQLVAITAGQKEGRHHDVLLAVVADFAGKAEADEPRRERVASLQDQLLPLLFEEQKLLESRGRMHPEVVSVRKRIEAVRDLFARPSAAWDDAHGAVPPGDPVDRYVVFLRQRLLHLTQLEELVAELYRSEHEAAKKLASYEIQDESLRTSITLARQSYESINKRLQDVSVVKEMGGYEVEAINPPSMARKASPNLAMALSVIAVLGVMAGLALAYAADARAAFAPLGNNQGYQAADIQERDSTPVPVPETVTGNGSAIAP